MLNWLPKKFRAPLGAFAALVCVATFLWQFDTHYMALAADVAKKTTEATVNKAVIDDVKKAAREAVNEATQAKMEEVAQKAAEGAVQKYVEAQKKAEEQKPKPAPKPKRPDR